MKKRVHTSCSSSAGPVPVVGLAAGGCFFFPEPGGRPRFLLGGSSAAAAGAAAAAGTAGASAAAGAVLPVMPGEPLLITALPCLQIRTTQGLGSLSTCRLQLHQLTAMQGRSIHPLGHLKPAASPAGASCCSFGGRPRFFLGRSAADGGAAAACGCFGGRPRLRFGTSTAAPAEAGSTIPVASGFCFGGRPRLRLGASPATAAGAAPSASPASGFRFGGRPGLRFGATTSGTAGFRRGCSCFRGRPGRGATNTSLAAAACRMHSMSLSGHVPRGE